MFKGLVLVLIIGSITGFFYGVGNLYTEVEPNACRMTYMFGEPMFSPINFTANKEFANYGLYYYYEGIRQHIDPFKTRMTGAPVIFVPGNAGSYKQVRSLASVALRKAISNDAGIHLDYYTIDFNEELSGFYGGYLYQQQAFLKHCIRVVLSMYRNRGHSALVLIGHSMGGKVAQSVLTDTEISPYINTIISISTPLDKPVLNLDAKIAEFYRETNEQLLQSRTALTPTASTNVCNNLHQKDTGDKKSLRHGHSARLDNVLLISTGGGNRDLLVRPGYTSSVFNDVHAMTSAIPKVGVSCDHLSAVWCLQFMQVINRFLFSIAHVRDDKSVIFRNNKQQNLQSAVVYFVKQRYTGRSKQTEFKPRFNWHEERRLVINKYFSNGLTTHYHDLISILRQERLKKMAIEAYNVDENNWLFGCLAEEHNETGRLYCPNATPLPHLVQRLPDSDGASRSVAVLDLYNLRKTYRSWTHILVRLPPSSKRIGFNLDIYDPKERTIDIRMPRWYTFAEKTALNETLQGTLHYRLRISELLEPFQAVEVQVEPTHCLHDSYRISTKLCVPWAAGYDHYQLLTSPRQKPGLYVSVPLVIPRHYNTTLNPIVLDMFLDPNCRYSVKYRYSYKATLSRLILEFYGWLPAHLICVFLIVLKNQVDSFQLSGTLKSLKPYIGYFQFTSLYIVTGCRLLKKAILTARILPIPEPYDYSMNVSITIHSMAIGFSLAAAFILWAALTFYGNVMQRFALRLTRLTQTSSGFLLTLMTHLPITLGVLTIAVAMGSCSGIALLLGFIFYFLMLSNAYKDYLEDYIIQKAADFLNLGKDNSMKSEADNKTETAESTEAAPSAPTEKPAAESNEIAALEEDPFDGSSDDEASYTEDISSNEDNDENDNDPAGADQGNKKEKDKTEAADKKPCLGMQNFPFHITLLLMLFILVLLNLPATLAWVRSRSQGINMPDPSLFPSIVVLASLSVLLQLKAPQKCKGYWTISVGLYICSGISLLYCQGCIYRLNSVIASAFGLLAMHQGASIVWRVATKRVC